jgi:hypothetical protein
MPVSWGPNGLHRNSQNLMHQPGVTYPLLNTVP